MTTLSGPFVLGVDLGKAQDHTAIVLAEPSGVAPTVYDLTHIERVPLKTRYTDVASHLRGVVNFLAQPQRPVTIVLDYTGVGIAVAEIFLAARIGCPIVLLTITAGGKVTTDEVGVHVPKADLVSVVQRLLQEERLRLPDDDDQADLLIRELGDFQAVIKPSGHVSYGVSADWREGQHDDLVLAAALALWWGESAPRPEIW